ncbi:hypothetical protein BGZ76_011896 [Entomortierella beljakovae]|nr:hypothetical protein BGZ76_011896 [Entomortierella beljakovae]
MTPQVKDFEEFLALALSPPMDWMNMQPLEYNGDGFEPVPGLDTPEPDEGNMLLREDEQSGWMERTLSAAGLNEQDYDNDELSRKNNSKLPQTLHTYLSNVFDVNWSVDLPSKEDLFFTHAPSNNPSTSFSAPALSSVASKRKSITAASGLSLVSFNADTIGNSPSPRSSTTSTSSSFSTISSASSASSVSSVGSIKNGTATPPIPLVRKSSLSASSGPNNVTSTPTYPSEGRTIPTRKTSINHPKPTLVPGRRSSLLQTGQMPPPLPAKNTSNAGNPSSNISNNYANTHNNNNNNNSNNNNNNGLATPEPTPPTRVPSPSLSPIPRSPTPPARSPPLSYTNTSSTSPTLQPSKPAFSRRTSSLPVERPKAVQRTPSSENNQLLPPIPPSSSSSSPTLSVPQANIIGLPRPLLSSGPPELSSSPPSKTNIGSTLSPASAHSQGGAPRFLRSNSEEQVATRHNMSYNSNKSPPTSPTHYPIQSNSNYSLPYSYSNGQQQQQLNNTLSKPSPTYHKGSKSSPCLVGSENDLLDESANQPMPDLYAQHQYQQNSSHATFGKDGSVPVVRPLARSSSRRAMESYNSKADATVGSGSGSRSRSNHGTMNISSPLPLIPTSSSFNDYDSSYDDNSYDQGHQGHPYGHGNGHKYTQSMSNVSVISNSSVMTSNSQKSEKAGSGRWSSMKMMFGLRVGQSTKG